MNPYRATSAFSHIALYYAVLYYLREDDSNNDFILGQQFEYEDASCEVFRFMGELE